VSKIFISYRRDDSAYVADAIRIRLETEFGPDSIFMDIDSIPLGSDFRSTLTKAVETCDVLLAVIGTNWLGSRPGGNAPRITDPQDFVRIEVEVALSRGIPVVPVLVDDAKLPSAPELPESLADLLFRHAAEVRPGRDLRQHLDALSRRLARQLTQTTKAHERTKRPWIIAVSIGGLAVVALVAWKALSLQSLSPSSVATDLCQHLNGRSIDMTSAGYRGTVGPKGIIMQTGGFVTETVFSGSDTVKEFGEILHDPTVGHCDSNSITMTLKLRNQTTQHYTGKLFADPTGKIGVEGSFPYLSGESRWSGWIIPATEN
jgi:hypothetical protein